MFVVMKFPEKYVFQSSCDVNADSVRLVNNVCVCVCVCVCMYVTKISPIAIPRDEPYIVL